MADGVQLLIIDPQVDFCDPQGALYVLGAENDMSRLAAMIRRVSQKLDDIHVTLDSHHWIHIAHPIFWQDSEGRHPAAFTRISKTDVEREVWIATKPELRERALEYVRTLAANHRYELTIWPPHCLIGSAGHCVYPGLYAALREWEERFAFVDYVFKGSNVMTEHYSAVQADVPDPADPSTQLNTRLIEALKTADVIGVAGEALTHCVANTVRDIAANFADDGLIPKMVLLTDASSSIPGFEEVASGFLKEMTGRGLRLSTTTEFLSEQ
jgi:nicotinamidase/pyrazinamidase